MDEASITVTDRSRPGCVSSGDSECLARYHDRAPVMIERADFDAWLSGEDAAALLRPAREDALQERIVSSRVNCFGVGDDDPTLIEPSTIAEPR